MRITAGEMRVEGSFDPSGREHAGALALARLNGRFETGIRSPLDAAILSAPASDEEGWSKLDEVPFDFERRRSSVVVERAGERLLVTKGAAESVLAVASGSRAEPNSCSNSSRRPKSAACWISCSRTAR